MPISQQTRVQLKIQTMLDRGMKWTQIAIKTKISKSRLQDLHAGRAVLMPAESDGILKVKI